MCLGETTIILDEEQNLEVHTSIDLFPKKRRRLYVLNQPDRSNNCGRDLTDLG